MKIEIDSIRPLYKTKKEPKVRDMPRIPKLMIPLENKVKSNYSFQMNKMLKDIADIMIEFSKQSK